MQHLRLRPVWILAAVYCLCLTVSYASLSQQRLRLATRDLPRSRFEQRRQTEDAKLNPEPCYPPPCPGYDYSKVVTTQKDGGSSPDNTFVRSSMYDPDAGSVGGMRPPPEGPLDDSNPSDTPSILSLPPPPMSFAQGIDNDPNDGSMAHLAKDSVREDLKELQKLATNFIKKQSLLESHDDWIRKAKQTQQNIGEMIKGVKMSKENVAVQIAQVQMRKQDLVKKMRADQLKSQLARTTDSLSELSAYAATLKSTNAVLAETKNQVQQQVNRLAAGLGAPTEPKALAEAIAEMQAKADPLLGQVASQYVGFPGFPDADQISDANLGEIPRARDMDDDDPIVGESETQNTLKMDAITDAVNQGKITGNLL